MNKEDFLDIREIRFGNQYDAKRALNSLEVLVEKRGFALSGDLISLSGHPMVGTMPYYGWTDLTGAYIYQSGDMYALSLPKLEKFIIAKEVPHERMVIPRTRDGV